MNRKQAKALRKLVAKRINPSWMRVVSAERNRNGRVYDEEFIAGEFRRIMSDRRYFNRHYLMINDHHDGIVPFDKDYSAIVKVRMCLAKIR